MRDIDALRVLPLLEPLTSFGQTQRVSPRVHAFGDGLFVFTREDECAYGVGWAESEYWAQRISQVPFAGELTPPVPTHELPSPDALGLVTPLAYGAILAHEREQPHFSMLSYTAEYRMTDGAFLFLEIEGANRTHYHFGTRKPRKHDPPVALVFKLADTLNRLTQRLDEDSHVTLRGAD